MFTHIRSSAPNMFAKFGWKTRTFCHHKVAKVIAKLESDRLTKVTFVDKSKFCHDKSTFV